MLYGIFFNGAAGGSVSNVTIDHIFQFQNFAFGSCQTGRAIRAENSGTLTITNTTVRDYQKSGFEARGTTIMNVSGSTAGPPHPLNGFIAQNAVSIVGASATIANNTIIGSGDQGPGLGRGNGTGVLLFGAHDVTVDHNTITGLDTNIGVSVTDSNGNGTGTGSTNITISFNAIGRTGADAPPDPGSGVDVGHPTLQCDADLQHLQRLEHQHRGRGTDLLHAAAQRHRMHRPTRPTPSALRVAPRRLPGRSRRGPCHRA